MWPHHVAPSLKMWRNKRWSATLSSFVSTTKGVAKQVGHVEASECVHIPLVGHTPVGFMSIVNGNFFERFLVPNCKAGMTGMMKSLHSKNLSYLGYNPSYKWINPIISYLDISWLPAEIWSNQKLKRPRGHRYPMPFAKHNRSAQSDGSNRPGEDSPRRQFSTSLNGTKRTVAWNPVNPFHVRPIKMASGGYAIFRHTDKGTTKLEMRK